MQRPWGGSGHGVFKDQQGGCVIEASATVERDSSGVPGVAKDQIG